jgi:dTDP-4-amino-4,6-dideoxygalactose transaminase
MRKKISLSPPHMSGNELCFIEDALNENWVAEKLFDDGLCLPSGSNLSDDDRARIAKVIRKVFSTESV